MRGQLIGVVLESRRDARLSQLTSVVLEPAGVCAIGSRRSGT